jgi:hypothetical protein
MLNLNERKPISFRQKVPQLLTELLRNHSGSVGPKAAKAN